MRNLTLKAWRTMTVNQSFVFWKSDIFTFMMWSRFQKKYYDEMDLKFQVLVLFAFCWNILRIRADNLILYQDLVFLYRN